MIQELLIRSEVHDQRDLMIRRFNEIAIALDANDPETVAAATALHTSANELREVAAALQAEADEEALEKKDDKGGAYIPSEPLTCMMQAHIEKVAMSEGWVDNLPAATRGLAPSLVPMADTTFDPLKRGTGKRGLIGDFVDGSDLLYVLEGARALAWRKLKGKAEFNSRAAVPADLGSEARVWLFGDWATGIPRAQALAKTIAELANASVDDKRQHLVHLGDTYYVGWDWEYERRFIPNWPAVKAGRVATHWSLNGNHDMYSGGQGYFSTLLSHQIFASHRDELGIPSSFFLLENLHWQIFGLDSAYDSPDLRGMHGALNKPQIDFIKAQANPDKRIILLSHHQLYSARAEESQSPQMREALVTAGVWPLVRGWIWGHEHRCVIYNAAWSQQTQQLPFGLCLGNSGVPVKEDDSELAPGVDWEYRDGFKQGFSRYSYFAFGSLEFSSDHPQEVKVNINGQDGGVLPTKPASLTIHY